MNEQNRIYILNLNCNEVPWHRLTTAYGRATGFPKYFDILRIMDNMKASKDALHEITMNTEHQSTLWHCSPFAMIFLARILRQALAEHTNYKVAHYIADQLLDFFFLIVQCFHDGDEMEHADPLPFFYDMLKEEYLWSEEYDEEEDEMRYEEDDVFPDDLFYSFYYYSYQAILTYRSILKQISDSTLTAKATKLLGFLEQEEKP